jgi:hypothetical protein
VEGRQGVVYWQPPKEALDKVKTLVDDPAVSSYGADDGLPDLREALLEKASALPLSICYLNQSHCMEHLFISSCGHTP